MWAPPCRGPGFRARRTDCHGGQDRAFGPDWGFIGSHKAGRGTQPVKTHSPGCAHTRLGPGRTALGVTPCPRQLRPPSKM